jgi:hypothetical protein
MEQRSHDGPEQSYPAGSVSCGYEGVGVIHLKFIGIGLVVIATISAVGMAIVSSTILTQWFLVAAGLVMAYALGVTLTELIKSW